MGSFYEKELQKTNQKELRIEKVIEKKGNKLYVQWKGYNNSFNSSIDKKDLNKMSQYFPPYRSHGGDIKIKLDLSNYPTKTDLKNVIHVNVSSFVSKTNLASLKADVDKIDAAKLKTVPVDLTKLGNVVKNDVVKKTEYDSCKTKVDSIDSTNFVLKTKYEKDGSNFENKISKIDKKISDVSYLVKKTNFNTKVTEIEGKIPSISGLAPSTALTAAENKIPDVSSLVKKTDYNTKISEIENKVIDHNHYKYITTPEFNTMAADVFKARLAAQKDLIRKPDFDSKLKGISDRVTKNKAKYLLVQNELKKDKNLMLLILEVKDILKKMVHKVM